MESYRFVSIDEAIDRLKAMKKKEKNGKAIIFTIDFDNNTETKKVTTPEKVCILARASKAIAINEDAFIPHIQLFSNEQRDIEDIIKNGRVHDVILGNILFG